MKKNRRKRPFIWVIIIPWHYDWFWNLQKKFKRYLIYLFFSQTLQNNFNFSLQLVDWGSHEQDSKNELMNRRADDIQQFFNLIASSMEICKKFCERIPGIGDINPGDRELLYQSASLELVILRMAYRYLWFVIRIITQIITSLNTYLSILHV